MPAKAVGLSAQTYLRFAPILAPIFLPKASLNRKQANKKLRYVFGEGIDGAGFKRRVKQLREDRGRQIQYSEVRRLPRE